LKKAYTGIVIFLLAIITFILIFDSSSAIKPENYYQVYLDGEKIGVIESKEELNDYINSQGTQIKENVTNYQEKLEIINNTQEIINSITDEQLIDLNNQEKVKFIISNKDTYNLSDIKQNYLKKYLENKYYQISEIEIQEMTDYVETNEIYLTAQTIYTPNGIDIKKISTYKSDEIMDIPTIYNLIISKKSCTVAGYKFTIKQEIELSNESETKEPEKINKELIIYVNDPQIFVDSIDKMASIFIGEEEYKKYKENQQTEILTTGVRIENVYVEEDITYKAVNIDIGEKIYTNADDLSRFLLYGDNYETSKVKVQEGDSLESISIENEISIEELLISNPEYTSRNSLLYAGKEIVISKLYPQLSIVSETYSVSDMETNYSIIEEYDSSMNEGTEIVTQEGENGLERVTQNVKSVNGNIEYVEPVSKETLKSSVNKVITVGTKKIPHIGSTTSWGWPTASGYTISSYYGYRLAIFGEGNFHSGLDIAGTGYGSPVYASNNGTVIEKRNLGSYSYGIYLLIDHGNGYYSLYGHMSGYAQGIHEGSVVARGQVIGYVGSTGWSTGPHLHYEIRNCPKYGCTLNPLSFYR